MMMMGFGLGGMLLFWGTLLALLAGGAALGLAQVADTLPSESEQPLTAHQILDERLAHGEITCKDYDTIRARIQ